MANTSNSDKWYFTKEQLEKTASREKGMDAKKELQYRQQAANFIQDMGQTLKVAQLCINTAIVYMHRFYVFHSFTCFPWYQMAAAALFLAAKVEEQPRKLEYVIRVANMCRNPNDTIFDTNSEKYIAQSQDLVFNENVLLQTLGFDVAIDHPHTYVVRCCHLVRASKDLAQTSYFMASNSLHLTTMCIQYKPTVVACFCILLACKWSSWEIPLSNEKKEWYTYVDPTVTAELLEQLTDEFLVIFENCPSRLKEKIMSKQGHSIGSSKKEQDRKSESGSSKSLDHKVDEHSKHRSSMSHDVRTQEQKEREYKEKKERERIAHMSGITVHHQSHHHRPERYDFKTKPHSSRPMVNGPHHAATRNEPRDILRETTKEPIFALPSTDGIRENLKDSSSSSSAAHVDKDILKREQPSSKPTTTISDLHNFSNYPDISHPIDGRIQTEPHHESTKSEQMLKIDQAQYKPHDKSHDVENIKKHLFAGYDKNNAYLKSSTVTSHKMKQPFNLENKSVPKASCSNTSSSQSIPPYNTHYAGSNTNNGLYNKPLHELDFPKKPELLHGKEETTVFKKPSLFSPEKSPPRHDKPDFSLSHHVSKMPISNMTSLPPSMMNYTHRNQNTLERELRPTIAKIEQIEGFENLIRDSAVVENTIHKTSSSGIGGMNKSSLQPLKMEIKDEMNFNKEIASSSQSTIVNGLETNPTLISNLLKEAATTSHLPGVAVVAAAATVTAAGGASIKIEPNEVEVKTAPPEHKDKEHHHHKSKKKKDKHKHRDKDKNKDEKKKKHKEKEKDKHKHKDKRSTVPPTTTPAVTSVSSEPLKIKIQKDKIQAVNDNNSKSLKIKIAKDKIKSEMVGESSMSSSSGGLKIKISKDSISNCNTSSNNNSTSSSSISTNVSSANLSHSSSRKRVADPNSLSSDVSAIKTSKPNHKDTKQNGRHVNNKVAQSDYDSSIRRLAESKYSKGSS